MRRTVILAGIGITVSAALLFSGVRAFAYADEDADDSGVTVSIVEPIPETQAAEEEDESAADDNADTTPPTLNAVVNNGKLMVEAFDESGIAAIYVNSYEYADVPDGVLSIRLTQFDAGYEYFTVSAKDNAGNLSPDYNVKNPYYDDDPTDDDDHGLSELPEEAEATEPSSAVGTVTEHVLVASDDEDATVGREFYTIQTKNDKTFYLVVDQSEGAEQVYFLTEISDNDLLNVTENNSETLPRNSAVIDSAIPSSDSVDSKSETAEGTNDDGTVSADNADEEAAGDGSGDSTDSADAVGEGDGNSQAGNGGNAGTYIFLGIVAVAAIGAGYYFKVVRKKKDEFLDEEDEEDDDDEEVMEEDDADYDDFADEYAGNDSDSGDDYRVTDDRDDV